MSFLEEPDLVGETCSLPLVQRYMSFLEGGQELVHRYQLLVLLSTLSAGIHVVFGEGVLPTCSLPIAQGYMSFLTCPLTDLSSAVLVPYASWFLQFVAEDDPSCG
jgi:hypothetical protein